jgi:hypothetical protein
MSPCIWLEAKSIDLRREKSHISPANNGIGNLGVEG